MELLLASLATCAGASLESVVARMRIDTADLVVAVDAVRASEVPGIWTDIRIRYLVRGEASPHRIEHAAAVVGRTCPVSVMLARATKVTHETYLVSHVTESETIAVRHSILRSGMPRSSVAMHGDEAATWFGVQHEGRILGTAGIFEETSPEGDSHWRLRGMATMPEIRGVGLGAMLLDAAIDHVGSVSAGSLWCSARTPAADFYLKRGFETVSDEYEVEGIGPHVRMRLPRSSF